MTKKSIDNQAVFGIATVAQLTGISQHLLRIWEKRYDAVSVSRTETGRRRYSEADVDRLIRIKTLVDAGEPIGKIAQMSDEQLHSLLTSLRNRTRTRSRLQPALKIAVLGDYLPARLASPGSRREGIEVVAGSTSSETFRADIRRLQPDALVIELSVYNRDANQLLQTMKQESNARLVVVAYRFASSSELVDLRTQGIRPVRLPCEPQQIYEALLAEPVPETPEITDTPGPTGPIPEEPGELPGRRFETSELARLANASSTVECECPAHLVDLVIDLSAFEAYSAACASKDDKDAALHAYLHATAATVRATLEQALERVARAEGLIE